MRGKDGKKKIKRGARRRRSNSGYKGGDGAIVVIKNSEGIKCKVEVVTMIAQ